MLASLGTTGSPSGCRHSKSSSAPGAMLLGMNIYWCCRMMTLWLSHVGGSGLLSSSGGVRVRKSLKGGMVCSYPFKDHLNESFVVSGGCFKVGGMVCSIPASDGVDELLVRKGGLLSGILSTGSCGMRGSTQPAVSPKPVTGLDSINMAVGSAAKLIRWQTHVVSGGRQFETKKPCSRCSGQVSDRRDNGNE
jgi:hypothetical protein